MKSTCMMSWRTAWLVRLAVMLLCLLGTLPARAITNVFFNASQTATLLVSNINSVTIASGDYRFTYSADGYWSPSQGGTPTGRFFSVFWPNGVQAQAITTGPNLGAGANITIKRADGKPFDLNAFTGKILANTAGAGAQFELMPRLNGNDAFANPLMFDATGYGGQSFAHTPALSGYDTYNIHLWVDYALTALTLIDTNAVVPPGPTNTIVTAVSPAGAGTAGGGGKYSSNSICSLLASPNANWGFLNWTENGLAVSTSPNYSFTVRSNRTLVANFVPAFTVTTGVAPAYGGSTSGGGTYNSNALVTVIATPNPGFAFVNWSELGTPVSPLTNYAFNISGNRALVANFAPVGVSATFDFDTGSPPVGPTQGMPATQTQNGVTATFSTLAGGWSVQNTFYGWKPAFFSGNFLYPSTWGSTLAIEFSLPVTNFTMAFFTGEVSSEYDTAALVRVTAYTNAAMTSPVATGTARGGWLTGAYPEGVLTFGSATPFTRVKIDVPSQSPVPSYLFFVDNIVVQTTATATNQPPLAFGGNFFQLAGQPLAINISDLMWNDYDPDSAFVWFKSVSATSSHGLALTTNATQVLVPANSAGDSFTYTIADSQGATAVGTATLTIITNVTSQALGVDLLSTPGMATVSFTGVPWYYYECQRATNVTFTGTLQSWPVQAGPDGSIYIWDAFADLSNRPPHAFYRLRYLPP